MSRLWDYQGGDEHGPLPPASRPLPSDARALPPSAARRAEPFLTAAEALHWLMQTQKNAPARGVTHYRVMAETGVVVGGPP